MELLSNFDYLKLISELIKYAFPVIALLLSLWSLIDSRKANSVQVRVNELEEKLKKIELEEKRKQLEEETKACVEARIYNISNGKYKLKIWNSGKATAYNVDFKVEDKMRGMIFRNNTPFEYLETGKSFEETAVRANGMPGKFKVITSWENKTNDEKFEKEQIVSY